MTSKFSERWGIVGVINPGAQTAAEKLTAAIDTSLYHDLVAVVASGTMGTSATIDATFKASATSGGTYAAITGKSITQLVKASHDNKQVLVNLRCDEIPSQKRYVKFSMTPGTATSDAAVLVLGRPRYAPATDGDLSSVVEAVL